MSRKVRSASCWSGSEPAKKNREGSPAREAAIEAEQKSVQRMQDVAQTAEAGLMEVSDQLSRLNGLAVANAGLLTDAERQANQLEMDSIVSSIDRIA